MPRTLYVVMCPEGWSGGIGPNGNEVVSIWEATGPDETADMPVLFPTRKEAAAYCDQPGEHVERVQQTVAGLWFPGWRQGASLGDLRRMAGRDA